MMIDYNVNKVISLTAINPHTKIFRAKSMKRHGKSTCMGCIPIEAVCFVYGIICGVLSIFGIVFLTLARIIFTSSEYYDETLVESVTFSEDMFEDLFADLYLMTTEPPTLFESLPLTSYAIILYVTYMGALGFSVLLCYGTHMRSPSCLKVYLVYGVVTAALMFIGLLYLYSWMYDQVGVFVMSVACCINLVVLRVVHRTYALFHAERTFDRDQLRGYKCKAQASRE